MGSIWKPTKFTPRPRPETAQAVMAAPASEPAPVAHQSLGLNLGASGWGDPDDYLYRNLNGTPRDLTSWSTQRAQDLCYRLWITNPLAKRMMELERDIVVGDGFRVETQDERLQEVLSAHWLHPQNQWDIFLPKFYLEGSILGEQCWPVSVNPISGQVLLGYLDPMNINGVLKDPLNMKFDGQVVTRNLFGLEERTFEVIRPDLTPGSKGYGRLKGECFFVAFNRFIGATRGVPDLFSLVDWLDGYDRMLFDQLERAGLLNAFIWDVTLKGMNQKGVDDWGKKNGRAPKPGSVRYHNDSVAWQAVSPEMGNQDLAIGARMIKQHMLGARSMPEHFFAEGGSANRATAAEMDFPTIKTLSSRQREWKQIVGQAMAFVRDQAVLAKAIPETDAPIVVQAPEISAKDLQVVGNTFFQVIQALSIARDNKWSTDEQAIKIVCQFAGQLGVECDPNEVIELMDNVTTGEARDYLRLAEKARRDGNAG